MEFRLLGPVEARVDDQLITTGPPKQRAVLAALLVDANTSVHADTLIDRVWGDTPPPVVRNALYSHIARIRRLVTDVSRRSGQPARIARRSGGYALEVDPERVDLFRWRRMVDMGRDPRRITAERAITLRSALTLWRGEALADVDGPWADQVRDGFVQQRLAALVTWGQLAVDLGQHEVVIVETVPAVAHFPLVEPLIAVLMRAFFLAGRAAEALNCYAAARRRFAHELGTEPGAELRDVHAAILRGELDSVRAS